MIYTSLKVKRIVAIILLAIIMVGLCSLTSINVKSYTASSDYIKWVDFNATYPALKKAMELDISSHNCGDVQFDWLEILAYITAKNGNDFLKYKSSDIDTLVKKLKSGKTMDELTENMQYYDRYLDIYESVLGNFLGTYEIETQTENGTYTFTEKYGLKAFSPIAEGYYYQHFDDFGNSRTYGYNRRHLGHDIMTSLGTPIIAVESGTVEEIGWNQYGGWRIGIRSHDKKRYYYYAHMRKDRPYHASITKGCEVKAGDVIGYVGRTGYSTTENVNNIIDNHLHFGMQLIYDESQKDNNEIWIDLFAITKLLESHRATVVRNEETKEYYRKYTVIETSASADLTDNSVQVPILMYHSILKHPKSGNQYEITPDAFEADLKYLKENGYETVTMGNLINYVYNGSPLPEKPIVLTFDDGNYNNLFYCEELLEKYGCKAVLSVVGQYSEDSTETGDINPNYSYVTWEQIAEINKKGLFEIQNHTWNMHSLKNGENGSAKKSGESAEIYKIRFTNDITKLQNKIFETIGNYPLTFTYPYGKVSDGTTEYLKEMGFKASLSCAEGVNLISRGNPEALFLMKRYIRSPARSAESILGGSK